MKFKLKKGQPKTTVVAPSAPSPEQQEQWLPCSFTGWTLPWYQVDDGSEAPPAPVTLIIDTKHSKASEFIYQEFQGLADFTVHAAKHGLSFGEKFAFWMFHWVRELSQRWFTHIALSLILVIYVTLGAIMFVFLEGGVRLHGRSELRDMRYDMAVNLSRTLNEDSNLSVDKVNMRRVVNIEQMLEEYEVRFLALRDASDTENPYDKWSFSNSVFYCGTILTTIGYGNIVAKTTPGRIATILYSIVGVPLFLTVLADFGKLLTRKLNYVWAFFQWVFSCDDDKSEKQKKLSKQDLNRSYQDAMHQRLEMSAVNDQQTPESGSSHARLAPYTESSRDAPFLDKDGNNMNIESPFVTERQNESLLLANESGTTNVSVPKVTNEVKDSLPVMTVKQTSAQAIINLKNESATSLANQQHTSNGFTNLLTIKLNYIWDIIKSAFSSDYRKCEKQNNISEQVLNRSFQDTMAPALSSVDNEVENKLHVTSDERVSSSAIMQVENKQCLASSASEQHSSTELNTSTAAAAVASTPTNTLDSVIHVTFPTLDAHTEPPDTPTPSTSGAQSKHEAGCDRSSSTLAPAPEPDKSNEAILLPSAQNPLLSLVCCSSEMFQIQEDDELDLPMSIALLILIIYIIFGAVGYAYIQPKWSFFESFYFVFISITTIGFGDLVPNHAMYMVAAILYFVFGLALASMCINVVSSKFSSSFKRASAKLGSSMGMQMVDGSLVPMSSKANISVIHANSSNPN